MENTETATTEVVKTPKVKATKVAKVKKEKTVKPAGKRGRPVSTTSARQGRLAGYEAKKASGIEVKRGRPQGSKQKVK